MTPRPPVPAPILALILALVPAAPALADEDCSVAPTQPAAEECVWRNFQAADGALNVAYGEIVGRLAGDESTRILLRDAQRAWVAFRDAECGFSASGVAQGSIHPLIWTTCRIDLAKARTDVLRGYLTCAEGDLACPVPPG